MSPRASAVLRRVVGALAVALLMEGCAALPPMPPRQETHALDAATPTALSARVAAERGPPGLSGQRLLENGEDALATLMWLADAAQRTLDLQYYAVLNDVSSRVLMQRVRAAADRGVRVRLLVDDLNTSGTDDALSRLTRHPRIEVRLYNPLPGGRMSTLTKVMASLHDAARINSRMHNKAFIADNAVAATGGRNLGDPYFIQTAEANFLDLDLLVAGPVVRQLSAVFDRFWNSELAYPADVVIPSHAKAPDAAASTPLDAPAALPTPEHDGMQQRLAQLRQGPMRLQWAPARLIADLPSKSLKEGEPSNAETLFDDLGALLRSAQREVLIVTPYFVPGAKGMAMVHDLRRRGVKLRVLTAAMASTDAPVVHVGYSKYRQALLDAGVELYEQRPEFRPEPRRQGGVHSRTNLHAKVIVVDGHTVLLGSMNLDPRSDKHNTEMGLLVKSAPLAAQLARIVDNVCRQGAYRVQRDDDGQLRWAYVERDGRAVTLTREPRVAWLKRLIYQLLSPLAPEELL